VNQEVDKVGRKGFSWRFGYATIRENAV